MINSILVPLDGYVFGEHALPMAMSLARRARAPLKLLHVLQPLVEVVPELAAYQGPMEAELRQEKQKYLDGVIRRILEVSDIQVTAEVVEGDVAPTIRESVRGKADLVVLTTHGRGPLARFWLGSTADALVRELSVPLLLLHPSKDAPDLHCEPAFKHILLPLDGTAFAEQIVLPAIEVAQLMNAEFTLFRVIRTELPADFGYQYQGSFLPVHARAMVTEMEAIQKRQRFESESYLQSVANRIRSQGLACMTKVMLDETPAAAILHEATVGMDLVALATHGYGGLKRLWLGSVADKLVRGSAVPVLVLRPQL